MCDEQKEFRYFPFDFYVAQASFEWPRVDLTRPRLKNSVPIKLNYIIVILNSARRILQC